MYTPTRMCVACREHRKPQELIRISYNTELQRAEPDSDTKAMGRGAYICRDIKCIERAKKKHIIEKHLKCSPCDLLYSEMEEML